MPAARKSTKAKDETVEAEAPVPAVAVDEPAPQHADGYEPASTDTLGHDRGKLGGVDTDDAAFTLATGPTSPSIADQIGGNPGEK